MTARHEAGSQLSFYYTVRRLHQEKPDCTPVGHLGPASREPVRLCHDPRLIFAASDVSSIEERNRYTIVTSTFLGLTGATSPLATFFAEEVLRAEDGQVNHLRLLYDFLHHRILSLLFRSWLKYRPAYQLSTSGFDDFTRRALALVGLDIEAAATQPTLGPSLQLALAPILSTRVRSARFLELVLRRAFPGVAISIENFVPRRAVINEAQRTRLRRPHHNQLARDFVLGARILDRSCRFRVRLGPVSFEQSDAFLPGGRHFPRLRGIVEHFTRGVLEAELEVWLSEDAVPMFRLASERGGILGVSTRFPSRSKGRTVTRVVLSEHSEQLCVSVSTEVD